MADATKRTVIRTRHEYVLRSPTHIHEVQKAENWAYRDIDTAGVKTDVWVEARDDEVVIWWETTDG